MSQNRGEKTASVSPAETTANPVAFSWLMFLKAFINPGMHKVRNMAVTPLRTPLTYATTTSNRGNAVSLLPRQDNHALHFLDGRLQGTTWPAGFTSAI